MNNVFSVAIIGGGPAGMMAAISSSQQNFKTCLLEKTASLGNKLLLTGKGRCNLTTNKTIPEIIDKFGAKGKFLYSALTRFSNVDLINFFNQRGIKTQVERGDRIFPSQGNAKTILNCLQKTLKQNKIKLIYNFPVVHLSYKKNTFKIYSANKKIILAQKVIIATGGLSYPATGSTGDGYQLAKKFGHQILPCYPALAPLFVKNQNIRSLAGLSLKNVRLTIFSNQKPLISFFGEMIFTHQGISGPIVLKTSKIVAKAIEKQQQITASIDLKPALSLKVLKQRLYREIKQMPKKEFQNLLKKLLPKSLIFFTCQKTKISKHKQNSLLKKKEILTLIKFLKNFSFKIDKAAPIQTAIVTSGGINPTEINSSTMESRLQKNLYFAGEIIALDGPTGGFNLQKAFSTGWLAGFSAKI